MRRAAAVALTLVFAPAAAQASQQGVLAARKWKTMDTCAVQAQNAFPDFTPDSNAKREQLLKECLAGHNLPPREPLSQPR